MLDSENPEASCPLRLAGHEPHEVCQQDYIKTTTIEWICRKHGRRRMSLTVCNTRPLLTIFGFLRKLRGGNQSTAALFGILTDFLIYGHAALFENKKHKNTKHKNQKINIQRSDFGLHEAVRARLAAAACFQALC